MSLRGSRRATRSGPAPELVAAILVVALSASVFLMSSSILASGPGSGPGPGPTQPAATASPVATIDPLQADIRAILEVDARLSLARDDLVAILSRSPFRGSEVAFVLRRIKTTLQPGIERVSRLATHPTSQELGAQLELLYATAGATADRASGLALGSDPAYRQAAEDIVDLFGDLPAIDDRLRMLLDGNPGSSQGPGTPAGTPAPTGASSAPTAPPSGGVASGAPSASIGVAPTPHPGEKLLDPGFETGIGPWAIRTSESGSLPTVRAGPPLGSTGTRSLQVTVPPATALTAISIGQGPIEIVATRRYTASVIVRASAERSIQLRVVGPAAETYGIGIVQVSPDASTAVIEFVAVVSDANATFWIDLGDPGGGTVWLDDASFVERGPD